MQPDQSIGTDNPFPMHPEYLQAMFQQAPIPIMVFNLDGRVIHANQACLQLFTCQSIWDLEKTAAFKKLIKDIEWEFIKGYSFTYVYELWPLSNPRRHSYYQCSWSSLRDQNRQVFAVVLYMSNVSEDIRLREQVKQRLERIQLLLDTIPYPVYYRNPQGVYEICNQALADWFGLYKSELQKTPLEELIPSYIIKANYRFLAESKNQPGDSEQFYEGQFMNGRGELREVMLSRTYITEDIDGSSGVAGILIDKTDQKKIEREVLHMDRLKVAGEIAASVAHEIRNPITAVYGFAQILRNFNDLKEHHQYLDWMLEELDRVNSCISEFLLLSVNSMLDLQAGNINTIIRDMALLIVNQSLEYNANVYFDLDPNLPEIQLNNKEIRQLIWHLVKNGLEALHDSGRIIIRTRYEAGKVILEVEDNGHGIPEEMLFKVGTPFFTTREGGSGLGLAISHSIALRHNAVIKINSKAGKTSVQVYFKSCNRA
ncbi:MAG TPA: PAS domain S-box protein [Syntrophomonadaceae bacterium]|nr:PAS domain S-box protein [Syntrophomonadaceae bacterium]